MLKGLTRPICVFDVCVCMLCFTCVWVLVSWTWLEKWFIYKMRALMCAVCVWRLNGFCCSCLSRIGPECVLTFKSNYQFLQTPKFRNFTVGLSSLLTCIPELVKKSEKLLLHYTYLLFIPTDAATFQITYLRWKWKEICLLFSSFFLPSFFGLYLVFGRVSSWNDQGMVSCR